MVEETYRVFFEEEMEDYGENLGLQIGKDAGRATRMSFQIYLEDGEPVRYVAHSGGGGTFTREQWLRFCDLITDINGEFL